MATSRGATPADPTLVATTDDNSRGGLFTRSNIANPVSGVDVNGVSINDSTITITLNYADGTSQMQSFMLNQPTDAPLSFTVPGSAGGGSSTDTNTFVTGGRLSTDLNSLILEYQDGTEANPIDISMLDAFTVAQIRAFADEQIAAASLVRTVNMLTPDADGNVTITTSGDNFDPSDTVIFSTDPGTGNVSAQARMAVGNGTTGTASNFADGLLVDPMTGYRIVEIGSTGTYVFEEIPAAPQPANRPTFTQPPPSSALSPSPAIMETLTAEAGTFNSVTATVTPPGGAAAVTPVVTGPGGGPVMMGDPTATITIPMGDANAPGDYMIMATTMTLGANGMVRTDTPMVTVNRFIPYFQSRTPLTTANVAMATASDGAWTNTVTAIAGTGSLYIAALESELPNSRMVVNQGPFQVFRLQPQPDVSVTLADGTTRTFNVFRVLANAGVELSNFRDSR